MDLGEKPELDKRRPALLTGAIGTPDDNATTKIIQELSFSDNIQLY